MLKPHIQHIIQYRYNIINFDSNHTANNFKKIKHVIVLIYVNNGLESLIVLNPLHSSSFWGFSAESLRQLYVGEVLL